jgi:hypothetical protein
MHAMENCVHPRGTALPRSRRPGAASACSTADDPGRLRPARPPTTPGGSGLPGRRRPRRHRPAKTPTATEAAGDGATQLRCPRCPSHVARHARRRRRGGHRRHRGAGHLRGRSDRLQERTALRRPSRQWPAGVGDRVHETGVGPITRRTAALLVVAPRAAAQRRRVRHANPASSGRRSGTASTAAAIASSRRPTPSSSRASSTTRHPRRRRPTRGRRQDRARDQALAEALRRPRVV